MPSNLQIRDQKFAKVLEFLASGEVWTTVQILQQLLGVSETATRRTIAHLIKLGALKTERLEVGSKNLILIGITTFGLEVAQQPGGRSFPLGKTNPLMVRHHLETQKARIKSESMGAINWTPGKLLYHSNLKKVPDATFVAGGKTFAVEIELTLKSLKAYPEIIAQHLLCIKDGHWVGVHYVLPPELLPRIIKTFENISLIPLDGGKVKFDEKFRVRFKFSSFDDWKI